MNADHLAVLERLTGEIGIEIPIAWDRYCGGDRVEWCAALVVWAWRQLDVPIPGPHHHSWLRAVWRLQRVLEDAGARIPHPVPGAIAIQTRGRTLVGLDGLLPQGQPGHVGVVGRVLEGRVQTVEGNVRGRVRIADHLLPSPRIVGWYLWPIPE